MANEQWAAPILDKHATILPSMKPLWPVSFLQNKCVINTGEKYRIYHSLHVFMLHIIKFTPFPNLWYTHMKRWNYSFSRWFHSRCISDLDFFHVWILSKVVVSGVLYVIFTLVAWFVFKFNFYLLFFFFKEGEWRGVTDEQWAKSIFLRKEIKGKLNEMFYSTKKGLFLHVIFKW